MNGNHLNSLSTAGAPDHRALCRLRRAPYALVVDAYAGCDLGCALCSAPLRVFPSPGPALSRFLKRHAKTVAGGWARLGEGCDAYPLAEDLHQATRAILEELARAGLGVEIFTRSRRILRDADLLRALAKEDAVRVTVKIPPSPRDVTLALEPGLGPAPDRFALVSELARMGIPVGVEATPVLPGFGDDRRSLGHLICAADEAGASYVRVSPLRLEGRVRSQLLTRLAALDAEGAERVRRCFGRTPWSPRFAEQVETTARSLRTTYRIPSEPTLLYQAQPIRVGFPTQLALFGAA